MRKVRVTKRKYLLLSLCIVAVVMAQICVMTLHLLQTRSQQDGTIIFASHISLTFFINYHNNHQIKEQKNIIEHEGLKQIPERKKIENELNFPEIDIVYTWVNGTDEEWLASKNYSHYEFLREITKESVVAKEDIDEDAKKDNGEHRYRTHDELRYSLRSILKHAPWANKIYLVVADGQRQIPSWLNISHPKINVVTHSDIFDNKSYLPTFNTNAIESQLDNIPGLADFYLYFNDDMFLGNSVTHNDFLPSKLTGQQIRYDEGWPARAFCSPGCYYRYFHNNRCDLACNVASCNFDYGDCGIEEMKSEKAKIKKRLRSNIKTFNLGKAGFWDNAKYVDGVFNREFKARNQPRNIIMHTPYLINRRMMKDLKQRFYDEFDWTASHKFRHPEDMQLSFSYFHYLDSVRVYAPTSSQAWHSAFQTIYKNNRYHKEEKDKIFLYDKLPPKWDDVETQRYYNVSNSTDYQVLKQCTHDFVNEMCSTNSSTMENCSTYLNLYSLNEGLEQIITSSVCQYTMNKLLPILRLPIYDEKKGNKYNVDFQILYNDENFNRVHLQEVYLQKKKFVTINDDMPAYQPKVEEALACMYEVLFPDPSPFELLVLENGNININSTTTVSSLCNSTDNFKNYIPSKYAAEHYRAIRSENGWRKDTLDLKHAATFQHKTFTALTNPNDITSKVSGKYAHLFMDRTRTFTSPTGDTLP